jgi:hypothetical protein
MIDNVTGRATRVNLWPTTLEIILRDRRIDRHLMLGYVMTQLLEAARRLWPEFEPEHSVREPIAGHPLRRSTDEPQTRPFKPRWRRYLERDHE